MSNIHPTAIIEAGAKVGEDVTIEPYVIIKKNVTIGNGVIIKSHAYIDGYTTIGDETVIYPGVSIGTKTQDLKFQGEKTFVAIGKHCEIREFVTINASCREGTTVSVGDHCLIMAYCHIAHNCTVGNHVVMANGVMLAGYVTIEKFAIIGGMTPIHQFVRVGSYAMVGGQSRIGNDIPPYTLGGGIPYRLRGLNLVGLKRHNFKYDLRKALSQVFRLTYRSGYHLTDALKAIETSVERSQPVEHWLTFCRSSKRGLIGLQGVTSSTEDAMAEQCDLLEK